MIHTVSVPLSLEFDQSNFGFGTLEQIRVDENRLGRFIDPVNPL